MRATPVRTRARLEGIITELDRFIELLFRDSEAYRLALQLYAGRYETIACKDAAEILREVIEKHMPNNTHQATSEDDQERATE